MVEEFSKYDTGTIILYVCIILCATFFAYRAQTGLRHNKSTNDICRRNRKGMFIISFIILAVFVCFSGVGIDKSNYKYLFEQNEFNYMYPGVEVGCWLFICTFKLFSHNELLFLGVIAFLTILFTYKGIWACKNKISVGLAVFVFSSQYYLQSMNLVRMYFAMSILILGANLLFTEKHRRYIWYILLASSIHYSIIFILIAFIFYEILSAFDLQSSKFMFSLSIIAAIVVTYFGMDIVSQILGLQWDSLGKYSLYLSQATAGNVGFKWVLNILPFFVIYKVSTKLKLDKRFVYIAMSYAVVLFVVSIMGYSVPVLSRATTIFHMPLVIIIPYVLEEYRKRTCQRGFVHNSMRNVKLTGQQLLEIFIILYFVLLLFLYLRDYPALDGIATYKFIWE